MGLPDLGPRVLRRWNQTNRPRRSSSHICSLSLEKPGGFQNKANRSRCPQRTAVNYRIESLNWKAEHRVQKFAALYNSARIALPVCSSLGNTAWWTPCGQFWLILHPSSAQLSTSPHHNLRLSQMDERFNLAAANIRVDDSPGRERTVSMSHRPVPILEGDGNTTTMYMDHRSAYKEHEKDKESDGYRGV